MSPEKQHPGIMEHVRRNLRAPERMISLKNSVYVEVFGGTAGGRPLRLNNVEWRRGENLTFQMIPARMSLDSIIQYVSVELKLNSKNEAHIKDRHNHGNHDRREDRHHREVQDDLGGSSEDAGGESMTREDHEEAHFFAFVVHNTKEHGQDKLRWRRTPLRGGMRKRCGGLAIRRSPSRNTSENMTDARSVMGRISHTNTIIRRARSTRRTRRPISKPTLRRCPKRSV